MENTQTLFNELHKYTMNVQEETGWPTEKSWQHILDTHGHKLKAAGKALALEDIRQEEADPEGTILSHARSYEKDGRITIKSVRRYKQERPDVYAAYDYQVRGGSPHMRDAGFELAQKAALYSRENNVNFKTAAREVMAENPALTEQWHYGGKVLAKPSRQYQDEEMDGATVGNAFQKLGALIAPLVNADDILGAVRLANENRRLAEEAASEWLLRAGRQRAQSLALPGLSSVNDAFGRGQVLRERPEINRMIGSGIVTEGTLRTLYVGMFKS